MSDITFIHDGDEFFEYLWKQIDNSKVCCWVLSYHIVDNFIANETLKHLIQAAQRGVNVVLFIDSLNFGMNEALKSKLEEAGGTVRALNPMNFFARFRMKLALTRGIFERYHQKLFLIDSTCIIGSANIDSAYGGPRYGESKFWDLNAIVTHKCITEAQSVFQNIADRYDWALETPRIPEEIDPDVEILVSEPHYFRFDIQERILSMISNASERILLINGYYYDLPKVTKELKKAIDRGVKVQLITSKIRDQPVYMFFENSWLTKDLRDIGVKVYEYPNNILHMKSYIVDDEFTLGSFNHDRWSWGLNNELNLYASGKERTEELIKIFEVVKEKSNKVEDKEIGVFKMCLIKFWELFLKLSESAMDRRKPNKAYFLQASYFESNRSQEEKLKKHIKKREKYSKELSQALLIDLYI